MNPVEIDGGKYRVVLDIDDRLIAYRYGVVWRDLVGDNLILALCQEINRLKEELAKEKSLETV